MPANNTGGAGGVKASLTRDIPVVDHRHHVLTDGRGHYRWLLCRRTGRLERLKGARA